MAQPLQIRITRLIADWEGLIKSACYLSRSSVDAWRECYQNLGPYESLGSILTWYFHPISYRVWLTYARSYGLAKARNLKYVRQELETNREWFDSVESNPLTEKQRQAVVRDENNCLVVAGAGTGKTSTVVAKAGYVVKRGFVKPQDVVLLSFSRKAAAEMKKRIAERLKIEIKTTTFHSLGLEIISEAAGRKPSISELAEDAQAFKAWVENCINSLLKSKEYGWKIIEYFSFYLRPYKGPASFSNATDYATHLNSQEIRTLKGEKVKSHEECAIANWLLLNGIKYQYEREYEVDTATIQRRQYSPDFFLPDHGVYLEHFGVDRNMRPAPFIDAKAYRRDMEWKRKMHKENGTTLVETFSFERQEGNLLAGLETKLRAHKITPAPIPMSKARSLAAGNDDISMFAAVLSTVARLFKSNQLTFPELLDNARDSLDRERGKAFCEIFEEVMRRYDAHLSKTNAIDFEDMIRDATSLVEGGNCPGHLRFKYFIVDEFQDISRGRAKLLKALLDLDPHRRLFCVGDDWQSIFRFAGSDISIMRFFPRIFGFTEEVRLDKTFRFDKNLLEFSSRFIQRNPAQIKKHLISASGREGERVELVGKNPEDRNPLLSTLSAINDAEGESGAKVLILGRYNHNRPKDLARLRREFSKLAISFLTIHSSKGLEADYMILVDIFAGRQGFPCEIVDDPLIDLVLPESESFQNAEERRLFYVAITRARKKAYIIPGNGPTSSFQIEIAEKGYAPFVFSKETGFEASACPSCGGSVVRRGGKFGIYWVCSNFPICKQKFPKCPQCEKGGLSPRGNVVACNLKECAAAYSPCPKCGMGVVVERKGKYGVFWGCSMWRKQGPSCDFTKKK